MDLRASSRRLREPFFRALTSSKGGHFLRALVPIFPPSLRGNDAVVHAEPGASQQEVAELRDEISRLKAERALEGKAEALDG